MFMINGRIKPNERLSLPELAKELEVSVTPVREALSQLTETGLVQYKANRGFFVADIDDQEAIELYQIIALLESEAISQIQYTVEDITHLRQLNQRFIDAETNSARTRADHLFHVYLLIHNSNQSLKKIVDNIRARIAIYEQKFMDFTPAMTSFENHERVISALANQDINTAQQELRANWQLSIDFINGLNP